MPTRPDVLTAARAHPRALAAAAVAVVVALAALAAVLAGVLGGGEGEPRAAAPGTPSSSAPASPGVDTTEEATFARMRPGYPDRLVVPALDVDAPVVAVEAPDRTLTPPADPQVLGWWVGGARPGSPTGSALIAGHTVHTGGGALDDLETLEEGDEVLVRSRLRRDGEDVERETSYVVRSVEVFRKGTIAARAEQLFSQEVEGRLVLLTCEDWDGTRYLSNVVVTAVPVADAGREGRQGREDGVDG